MAVKFLHHENNLKRNSVKTSGITRVITGNYCKNVTAFTKGRKKKDEVVFIDNLTDEQNKTLHNINTTFCLLKISTK